MDIVLAGVFRELDFAQCPAEYCAARNAARAIKYVRALVGIEHVALGSDFDGATTTRFDTSGLAQITPALLDEWLPVPAAAQQCVQFERLARIETRRWFI